MAFETLESPAQQQANRNPAARLQQAIEPMRQQFSTAYSAAQDKSKEAMQGAEAYIHRSPFRSIAYAAGIAAVIGAVSVALFGRRDGKQRSDLTE